MRADLLTTLSIFGKLAYPDLDVVQLIGREQMKESKFYQEVMAEGAVERARADVLENIDVRFGSEAAAEFKEALQGVADLSQLSQLHRLAIQCRRLAEFRRAIASGVSTR